jgi:hypothetical protein
MGWRSNSPYYHHLALVDSSCPLSARQLRRNVRHFRVAKVIGSGKNVNVLSANERKRNESKNDDANLPFSKLNRSRLSVDACKGKWLQRVNGGRATN